MTEMKNCPSTLIEGFDTYSPKAIKTLFGGAKVNPILNFDIDEFRIAQSYLPEKAKRDYTRIVNERITHFIRESE